jgi:hypothetical protein
VFTTRYGLGLLIKPACDSCLKRDVKFLIHYLVSVQQKGLPAVEATGLHGEAGGADAAMETHMRWRRRDSGRERRGGTCLPVGRPQLIL